MARVSERTPLEERQQLTPIGLPTKAFRAAALIRPPKKGC